MRNKTLILPKVEFLKRLKANVGLREFDYTELHKVRDEMIAEGLLKPFKNYKLGYFMAFHFLLEDCLKNKELVITRTRPAYYRLKEQKDA